LVVNSFALLLGFGVLLRRVAGVKIIARFTMPARASAVEAAHFGVVSFLAGRLRFCGFIACFVTADVSIFAALSIFWFGRYPRVFFAFALFSFLL
jgi:hypothetical protein